MLGEHPCVSLCRECSDLRSIYGRVRSEDSAYLLYVHDHRQDVLFTLAHDTTCNWLSKVD